MSDLRDTKVVALAGGVGGAKLADGLADLLSGNLTVIVNTADDFEHIGLSISPDIDTVTYTLAGIANPETGWGVANETWNFLAQLERLGGPVWFRLGDKDLATHILRSEELRLGRSLTRVTQDFTRALGIAAHILPMSNQPVRSFVKTEEGLMPFQEYFVGRHCNIAVSGVVLEGLQIARPTPEVSLALGDPSLGAVIFCPSNPYVSIGPIVDIPGMKDLLRTSSAPVVAVSPIIAGAAVKGPAAKMMEELGQTPTAAAVAALYRGMIDGFVIDEADGDQAEEIRNMGIAVCVAPTLMRDRNDRSKLARRCIEFAESLPRKGRS